jgi:phytoene desaturase
VVVIGAGVGGLAVAARLAATGHRVTVCEQAPVVGGKLGSLERDGFRFDTGPSLLTLPYVFEDLFAATGAPLAEVLELVELDPIVRHRFADGTVLDTCRDPRELRARIAAAFGAPAAAQWQAFAERAARIWDATRGPFLESPLDGPRTLLRQAARVGDLRTIAPWRTLRGLTRSYLDDPRLRMLVERYATYTGSDPRHAPAALASVAHAELHFGGWYVRGGLRRLADALAGRCAALGVELCTSTEVIRVTTEGGRATGVELADGTVHHADVVVANADAEHVYTDLVPVPAEVRRRAPRSLSGFVLLLGLRGRTPGLAHHTVTFPADYDAEFDAVFGREARPVADPAVYVSVPPDAAPGGHEAAFVLVNAPRHGDAHGASSRASGPGPGTVDWRAPGLAESYADRLTGRLGVADRVLFREIVSPADLEARTRAVGGAIYGTSSNGPRAAFLRPANRSPVPGLYLVGGSSHPGGGLPLVALSAQITAGLIGGA